MTRFFVSSAKRLALRRSWRCRAARRAFSASASTAPASSGARRQPSPAKAANSRGLGGRRSQGPAGSLLRARRRARRRELRRRHASPAPDLLAQRLRDGHAVARPPDGSAAAAPAIEHRVHRRPEQRQRAAQTTQTRAAGACSSPEVAAGDLAGVDDDLLHAFAQRGASCARRRTHVHPAPPAPALRSLALRAGGEAACRARPTAHVEPEAVAYHHVARGGSSAAGSPRSSSISSSHTGAGIASDDAALVEGQLQQRAGRCSAARRAADVGAVAADASSGPRPLARPLARRRAGMQRQVR